jgi:hypothetical protein
MSMHNAKAYKMQMQIIAIIDVTDIVVSINFFSSDLISHLSPLIIGKHFHFA